MTRPGFEDSVAGDDDAYDGDGGRDGEIVGMVQESDVTGTLQASGVSEDFVTTDGNSRGDGESGADDMDGQ